MRRNPLQLNDDALVENGLVGVVKSRPGLNDPFNQPVAISQADGLGDDSQVPEVIE